MDAASPLLQRTAAFARGVVGPGAPRWEAERRIAREAIAEAAAIGLTGLEELVGLSAEQIGRRRQLVDKSIHRADVGGRVAAAGIFDSLARGIDAEAQSRHEQGVVGHREIDIPIEQTQHLARREAFLVQRFRVRRRVLRVRDRRIRRSGHRARRHMRFQSFDALRCRLQADTTALAQQLDRIQRAAFDQRLPHVGRQLVQR